MESKNKTNEQTKLIDTGKRLVVAIEEGGECGQKEGGQEVQTSSYKINKSWGCNIQHDDYSQ